MIDQLPEGKSIGWMQAPPQWIFTHTIRFIGIVRIVIQDGEGFILILKGKPLAYYFKHGRIELKGHAALDYFNSHPTIEFNLCKYTLEEFAVALRVCNIDENGQPTVPEVELRNIDVPPERPAQPQPAKTATAPVASTPQPAAQVAEQKTPAPEQDPIVIPPARPAAPAVERAPEPVPVSAPPAVEEKPLAKATTWSIPPAPPVFPAKTTDISREAAIPSSQVILDEDTLKVIGQIKKLNGIVAISVFNEDRNIIMMGDVEIEPLLKIARNMLATTRKITPHLEWGSFVHMTLQIPEGNVIVAPYAEYHLCILTTRTINIGHIRRILRDLQISSEQD
jgi:hypothetical protein